MRCFKTKKHAFLARMLLEFTDIEEHLKLRRATKEGWVRLNTLKQYFGDSEMRKAYPVADVEQVLTALVNAGLLEERDLHV